MSVKKVKTLEEFHEIICGDTPAVFEFWAESSKAIASTYEKLSVQYRGINFYEVNADECEDICEEVGVRAMPTFVAYRQGQKLKEVQGANSPALQALVSQL